MAVSSDAAGAIPARDLDAVLTDPKAAFRLRVLRAALPLVADRGLQVSMDDLADAAGVGRRSLFRHFESRDALLASALTMAMQRYDDHVERSLNADEPLDSWLAHVVAQSHRAHRDAGRGLWQLAAADDDDLPGPLAEANRRRRAARARWTESVARAAWRRAGGAGRCPASVVDAFALAMSSFATRSLLTDLDRDPSAVSRHTAAHLALLVDHEVGARRGLPGGP